MMKSEEQDLAFLPELPEYQNIQENKQKLNCHCLSIKVISISSFLVFAGSFSGLWLGIRFNIFLALSISFVLVILLLLFLKIFLRRLEKSGYTENWHDLYGDRIFDLPYFKNNIINNSFKINGDNYNKEIGDVYNGRDYTKNDRNYYNLYIPYSSLKNKNKYNRIILCIPGGGWKHGDKENIDFFTIRYAKFGYITASMNYTLLRSKYEGYSIFRIMDEITVCI